MSKVSKNKKLLLGSALAGLVLSGPGLSVTANTESGAKFFRTAELEVGYRLAGAAEEKKAEAATPATPATSATPAKPGTAGTATTPATSATPATPATPTSDKKDADKHCGKDGKCSADKKCGKDGKCSADKKCGKDGKCGGDKHCGKDGKCAADKKTDTTTTPSTSAKPASDKACGAGSCGGHK